MKNYARIESGVVAETIELDDALDITKMFHPSLQFAECPENIKQGDLFDGSEFSVPEALPVDLDKLKADKIQTLLITMRANLASKIGDYGDNIVSLLKTMVLFRSIQNGTVSDAGIVDRFDGYCATMLQGYGGAKSIMDELETTAQHLAVLLFPYYTARDTVLAATTPEEVAAVTL